MFVVSTFACYLLQIGIDTTLLLIQLVALTIELLPLFTQQTIVAFHLLVQQGYLFVQFGKSAASILFGIIEFGSAIFYLFLGIEQRPITFNHPIGLLADRHYSVLVLLHPQHHIVIFLFKGLYLTAVVTKVDNKFIVVHRLNNGIFDEVGIQFGVQEHILNGTGDVLIARTLHNGIFAELQQLRLPVVTKDNVSKHIIAGHQR